ncbi:helix-turn-helix transcriptional regulator [Polaribacter litorisediminis]|uniref:ligand-binding sensor domain-containing protein n=1 Tax=Polaribacter litorisediminis TaxID=1908341 RepID=UPI001CBC0E70|nr:helix-turn-helix transcriptional regulator [Polaribacter litorisediminis]UAM96903.1 helix-turn-helix transcriptional regulator [Polaribacter litorisediminis]
MIPFLSTQLIFSQNYTVEVQKVLGLYENIITDIEQDIKGFIWVSGSKYLTKYNNQDFVNYSKEDLLLKPQHVAISATSDAQGDIWFFPSNDIIIHILNTKNNKTYTLKEKFPNLPFLESDIINKPYRDQLYNIYISVKNKGLYKYDGKELKLFRKIIEKNDRAISFISTEKYNWYAYNQTIIKQNKDNLFEEIIKTDIEVTELNVFNNEPVLVIHAFANSYDKFTAKYLKGDNSISVFPDLQLQSDNFSDLTFFQKTSTNHYWINEKESLKKIDKNKNVVYTIRKSDYPFGKRFKRFFVDKNDIIWILTETSLYKVILKNKKFKKYLDGFSLKSMFKRDSNLYITTFYHGVKKFISNDKIVQFKNLPENDSFIGTFQEKDTLWITRYSQVLKYNFKTNKIVVYNKTIKPSPKSRDLASIIRHPKTKSIFIGNSFYFTQLDEQEKTVAIAHHLDKYIDEEERSEINVRCLKVYGDSLWIGTAKGLFLMNHQEKITRAYTPKNGFPKDLIIQHIYIENDTTFWLGTQGQGLVKWNRLKNTFTNYTTKEGLSNNNVYGVFKDPYGFLWLPTDYGLNRFAPKTLKNNVFLPDEISHQEFNHLSNFIDKEGTMHLGGLNGLNVFHPKDFLSIENKEFNLLLTNVRTTYEDNTITEDKTISTTDVIELNSNIKNTELEVLLLDFKNNLPLQYQYKITPFHENYVVANKNRITLPRKLEKGNYQLLVKAQSSNGSWSQLKTPIKINNSGSDHYLFKLAILFCIVLLGSGSLFMIQKKRKNNKVAFKTEFKPTEPEPTEPLKIATVPDTKENEWLAHLNTTIIHHLDSNNFSVEFLAEKMEMSERQLQRRVKKNINTTPNRYITEVRLKEAFRLLETKQVSSVKEVSKKVGYTTSEYFSKLFKNKYGKNPSDYL